MGTGECETLARLIIGINLGEVDVGRVRRSWSREVLQHQQVRLNDVNVAISRELSGGQGCFDGHNTTNQACSS